MPSAQPFPDAPPVPPQAPTLPQRKTLAAVVGAVAFVVVAGVVAAVVLAGSGTQDTPIGAPGDADSGLPAQQQPVSTPDSPEPTTTEPATDPVPTDEKSARQMLEDQVASDHAAVEAVTEQWVPQLSSKRFGLKVNGTVYNYRTIWADFENLSAEHPGAMMLWSGDYQSFKLPNFWVTIAPASYATGEQANEWCDTAGIDRDNCYAKRITHTGSYADSTMLR